MFELGSFALIGAFFLGCYACLAALFCGAKPQWRESAERGVYLFCLLGVTSLVCLAVAFVQHDYRFLYVWRTSNSDMSWYYLISAVWGGMDGSLLLWATFLTIYAAASLYHFSRTPSVSREFIRWYIVYASGAGVAFFAIVEFLTNPFRYATILASDGNGLNPLLQNPSMMIHPPSLYLGFTGMLVPAAAGLAAISCQVVPTWWTKILRPWMLLAWGALTLGIILGGNWAYIELGWGGFWAWDPVENASFLPWLAATAFLHSVMVEDRRGLHRTWNIILASLSYGLSVFGTFLTRSGVVQSVHAFAESDIGWAFLIVLGIQLLVTVFLVLKKRKQLHATGILESVISREIIFLINNLLLLCITAIIIWGVLLPVFSPYIFGKAQVVGPPFFTKTTSPLFLLLLFFMSIGPMIAWKKDTLWNVVRRASSSFTLGIIVTALCLFYRFDRPNAALGIGAAVFLIFSSLLELRMGLKKNLKFSGPGLLIQPKGRRYAGLIVHAGVGVMVIAMVASMAYKEEADLVFNRGETKTIGEYRLKYLELEELSNPNYTSLKSTIEVYNLNSDQPIATMFPERRFYFRSQESTTEVSLRMRPLNDLYLAFAGIDVKPEEMQQGAKVNLNEAKVILKVFVNPLQIWLWAGAAVVLSGTVCLLIGSLRRERE
jgi:cytochrome c-type biogenesis protein CcmF